VTLAVAIAVAVLLEGRSRPRDLPTEPPEPEPPRSRSREPGPEPIRIARIETTMQRERPPPDPPPKEPSPPPRSAPVPLPTTVAPTVDTVRRGQALLEAGVFPRLRATYVRIGFAAYRDAMIALGARFFSYDSTRRRPVAEVDPLTGAILGEAIPRALSRWPRDVTRHLRSALVSAQAIYGESASRIILLPPSHVDAALLGAVYAFVRGSGLDPSKIVRLDLAYELEEGRLRCEVLSAGMRDGSERALSFRVDLSATGDFS
jgi:hypothetical protein